MDEVRRRIEALVRREGSSLAEASRAIGRNHAYLQQFVRRGTPRTLPEEARRALARLFDVDEADLRGPHDAPAGFSPDRAPAGGRRVPRSLAARLSIARAESLFETPTAFAEAVGIDRQRYADLEDGEDAPSLAELDRISRCSDKPLDWFIRGQLAQIEGADGRGSPISPAPRDGRAAPGSGPRRRKGMAPGG